MYRINLYYVCKINHKNNAFLILTNNPLLCTTTVVNTFHPMNERNSVKSILLPQNEAHASGTLSDTLRDPFQIIHSLSKTPAILSHIDQASRSIMMR